MSLQLWLPLNKNPIIQQGLNTRNVTNNNTTYLSTGGKIGGCYEFNGTNSSIGIGDLSTLVNSDFSFSCWFYHDDTWSSKSWETIFGGPSGFELEMKNGSTNSPLVYAYSWGKGTFTYELNKWNHLVMTRTSSNTKFYLNGELKLTGGAGTIPSGNYYIGSWSSATSQNYKGKVNDIKIYNHCLSIKEIKELYKGLVLHCKLDNNGLGGKNLLYKKPKTISSTSYCAYQLDLTENLAAGETYTLQLWDVNVSHSAKTEAQTGVWVYWGGGSVQLFSWAGPTYFSNGHADYLEKTFTVTSANANGSGATNLWLNIYNSVPSVTGTMNMSIGKWKLEKGSVGTPYSLSPIDDKSNNIIYDSSGYNNNGEIIGTLNISSNSPKYLASTGFDGSTSLIQSTTAKLGLSGNCPFTMSAWVYWNENSWRSDYVGIVGNISNNTNGSAWMLIYNGRPDLDTWNHRYIATNALQVKTWYHIAIVKEPGGLSTTSHIYVNGEEVAGTGTTSEAPNIVDSGYRIGCANNTSSRHFPGFISDVRIYTTALNAAQIKELYNEKASMTNNSTLFAGQFNETEKISINKNNILSAEDFLEDDVLTNSKTVRFFNEINKIECSNMIEY